jgi:glycosyltransferase involved in cell wall biosynthesis
MVLLVHPFGNANVRAVLAALDGAGLLWRYVTTVGWSKHSSILAALPASLREKLSRRSYDLPHYQIKLRPGREIVRLIALSLGLRGLTEHEKGWASIDQVWQDLDGFAAAYVAQRQPGPGLRAVYAYEDCAAQLFEKAGELHLRRVYDLPIAYWETSQRLLQAEAARYPEWEPTLGATRDSKEKLARKTRELELAQVVICPSRFVFDSLPENTRREKLCVVAPFGSPAPPRSRRFDRPYGKLRFLFAGALSQRKGLADLFAAMKMLPAGDIELVVMGSLLLPIQFYRERFTRFIYEPPRPHAAVLRLMESCDVLVLPSIVEGRALVQQEAMACGLPLIVTRNAGGEDLIVEGETGFLVPAGDPKALAETMEWFLQNRKKLPGMREAARAKAAKLSWAAYGAQILHAIRG